MNGRRAVPWPFVCLKGTVSRHKLNGYSSGRSGQGTGEERVRNRSISKATTGTVVLPVPLLLEETRAVPSPYRSVSVPVLSTVDQYPSMVVMLS